MEFENIHRDPVDVVLKARKSINNMKPGDFKFEFVLKDENGNIVSKGTNDADGNIVFDKLTFDEAGTYYYTMSEVEYDSLFIKFDERVFDVKIEVTAPDNEDPFIATVTVSRSGKVYPNPTFKNTIKTNNRDDEDTPEEHNPSTGAPVIMNGAAMGTALIGTVTLAKIVEDKKRKK